MSYQDVWSDNQVVAIGERECAHRYEAIRQVLGSLQHPFSAMDLGANAGYFSVRLAEDFDCHVTAIDDYAPLASIASDRIDVLSRKMTAVQMSKLKRHDVTIALSVLHHMLDWREVLNDLVACRHGSIIEVPNPDEKWFKMAKARHEIEAIHTAVRSTATMEMGVFERVDRSGVSHDRPMYFIPGRVRRFTGIVFDGSGANSRRMKQFGNGLGAKLGYEPFWGSLNIRLSLKVPLKEPWLNWVGRNGSKTRDYQFWRAWIGNLPCHAMIPGNRSHGPDCLEIVAPMRLRNALKLNSGDNIAVDIETEPV